MKTGRPAADGDITRSCRALTDFYDGWLRPGVLGLTEDHVRRNLFVAAVQDFSQQGATFLAGSGWIPERASQINFPKVVMLMTGPDPAEALNGPDMQETRDWLLESLKWTLHILRSRNHNTPHLVHALRYGFRVLGIEPEEIGTSNVELTKLYKCSDLEPRKHRDLN
jgi:hypothetical protein